MVARTPSATRKPLPNVLADLVSTRPIEPTKGLTRVSERAPQILELLRLQILIGAVGQIVECAVVGEHDGAQQADDDLERCELIGGRHLAL